MITVGVIDINSLLSTIDTEHNLCNIDTAVKREVNLEPVTAFDSDFLDLFDHNVRLRHVNHGHSKSQIPIDESIVSGARVLTFNRLRCHLELLEVVSRVEKLLLSRAVQSFIWVIGLICLDSIEGGADVLTSLTGEEVCRQLWVGRWHANFLSCVRRFVPPCTIAPVGSGVL